MANRGTQTMYTVYPDDDDNEKVLCFKGTQTVTHIDVDEDSPDKVVAMLEFTPFSEIKENSIQIIDLPKHILKFSPANTSTVSYSNAKSALKKSTESISVKPKLNLESRLRTNDEAQTRLLVSPHLLGEDSLPTVVMENSTQTNFPVDYPEYKGKLSFSDIVKHETIPVYENYKNEQEKSSHMPASTSYISTVKFVSNVDMTASKTEIQMQKILENTVRKLQDQLERMFNEHCETYEVNDTDMYAQNDTNMIQPGDCSANKKKDILCECQCAGAGGGAVPKLKDPMDPNSVTKEEQHEKNDPENYRKCGNISKNASSWPDLNEHNIRLEKNKEKKIRCRCAKSDTTKTCAGFKADRVMMPTNTTAQSCCLLVDQEGDYADSYLELLAQEQIGTQTEVDGIETDNSDVSVNDKTECRCTPAIEMPWELLTYDPKGKEKKTPCPEPTPVKEESVEFSPSTVRLKQLTVEAMDDEKLLELTEDAIADNLGDEELTLSEVERRIMGLQNKDVLVPSITSLQSKDSQIIKHPRLPPRKAKPSLVYEPSCERHNEPYMDRMYQYFPDECEAMDPCPSHIEMPWHAIVLPKNCNIRKQYKPEKSKTDKDFNKHFSKQTGSRLDFHLSLRNFSSKYIDVENPAKDQTSVTSNAVNKPKPSHKTWTIHGSISQPFMPSHKKSDNLGISAKKSDLVRVLNFNDSKPSKPQHAAINIASPVNSPLPKQISNASSSGMTQSQRIAMLLESCKKEMEPIKDGINKLRLRIRELNLPDISSFQEVPQRPGGHAYPGFTTSFSGGMNPPPQMPYFTPPCWSPYYPYLTPYQIPQNYGASSAAQYHPKKFRSRPKSPKVRKTQSSSLSSSGADHSDLDSPEQLHSTCKQSTSTNNCIPKQQKPSKIPKPIKNRDSKISKTETIGNKSSRSTNTSECCIGVTELYCGIKERCSSNVIECGAMDTCSYNELPPVCSSGKMSSKASQTECGAYVCQQELVDDVSCVSKKKTVIRNKITIDLNDFIPINKYRKPTEEKSSLTVPNGCGKNKSNTAPVAPEKAGECLDCSKVDECD